MIRCFRGGLGSLDGCIGCIIFGRWCRHLWGRSNKVFVRGNRFKFYFSIKLQLFCRNFPEYFMEAFMIGRYLDRILSAWGFYIMLSTCTSSTSSKTFPLNPLAPLIFVETKGKYCWIASCNFLDWGSIGFEGIGELSIGFLVFVSDEDAGESTSLLVFCSNREIVWVRGFGVFGEWGFNGVTFPRSIDFLLVLIVIWGFENW